MWQPAHQSQQRYRMALPARFTLVKLHPERERLFNKNVVNKSTTRTQRVKGYKKKHSTQSASSITLDNEMILYRTGNLARNTILEWFCTSPRDVIWGLN